jgi:hypothetical protein
MQINAKIRKTGEQVTLRSYGFGYVDNMGRFYNRHQITVVEVFK